MGTVCAVALKHGPLALYGSDHKFQCYFIIISRDFNKARQCAGS